MPGTSLRAPLSAALVAILSAALAGCASSQGPMSMSAPPAAPPPPVASLPPAFQADAIVGRWGYAAYQKESDRPRIEKAAKAACTQPYVITRGPTGGAMMYLADQSKLVELRTKGGPGGKTYIGPEGPPADAQDREVLSFDGRVLVLRWVDPELDGRYSTGLYVRCNARA